MFDRLLVTGFVNISAGFSCIEIFKMSTLASAVAYVELLQQGKLIASVNYNPIEVYTVVALVFFVLLYPLVQASYGLERKLRRSD